MMQLSLSYVRGSEMLLCAQIYFITAHDYVWKIEGYIIILLFHNFLAQNLKFIIVVRRDVYFLSL